MACLWSHWQAAGEPDLLSLAAITDEPPPDAAAAGHNRCVIPLPESALDLWLNPDSGHLDTVDALLNSPRGAR